MNDNTVLRIKVPAHLYESVKEQLTLNEAKGANSYGGWTVVKEKKMKTPPDGMKKVEEADKTEKAPVKERTLEELKMAKEALEKKIQEMEGKHSVEEADDEDDSEDPLYLELVDELGEKILQQLFDDGWDIDDIAADPQGAAASLKRKKRRS